jgi:hypothetical protein
MPLYTTCHYTQHATIVVSASPYRLPFTAYDYTLLRSVFP